MYAKMRVKSMALSECPTIMLHNISRRAIGQLAGKLTVLGMGTLLHKISTSHVSFPQIFSSFILWHSVHYHYYYYYRFALTLSNIIKIAHHIIYDFVFDERCTLMELFYKERTYYFYYLVDAFHAIWLWKIWWFYLIFTFTINSWYNAKSYFLLYYIL